MTKTHLYASRLAWSGSTSDYASYDRGHDVELASGTVRMSADAAFRGDHTLPNPEQLVVAAASSCQMLSFLAVAARAKVEVTAYEDEATGEMPVARGPMSLTRIILRPQVTARGTDAATIERLLEQAHDECYIANSLRTEIVMEPQIVIV